MRYILVCIFLLPLLLFANIITIPIDFNTIQEGIDNAVLGDTVLVNPGTYYENLDMSYKTGITLCSLEATTLDTTYIGTTIIDGSLEEESTILCYEDVENCTIRGLSITGGRGHIFFDSHDINSYQVFGGGLTTFYNISLVVTNTYIFDNQASMGGGIWIGHDNVVIEMIGTKVYNNVGRYFGGGICLGSAWDETPNVIFDQINRCSIYNNNSPQGMDIGWSFNYGNQINIYLDLFTWHEPTKYFVNYADGNYSNIPYPFPIFDIQRSYITPFGSDLYVSMTGSDNNSGFTPQEPLRTTWKAFQKLAPSENNPLTVYLLEGDFEEIVNGVNTSITLKSNSTLQGVSPEQTHIYAENFVDTPVSGAISMGQHQTNMTVKDLSITTNYAKALGGYCNSNSLIENVLIENSTVKKHLVCFSGYEANAYMGDLRMKDVIISNSEADWGTFIGVTIGDLVFDNVTMTGNFAGMNHPPSRSEECGGYDISVSSSVSILNSSFYNNYSHSSRYYGSYRIRHDPNNLATIIIDNCLYADNISDGDNGNNYSNIIFGDYEDIQIINSTFANNTGVNDRYFTITDTISMYNCIFANNSNQYDVYLYENSNVDNCLFSRSNNQYEVYEDAPINFGANNLTGTDPIFVGGDPAFPEYYYLSGADSPQGQSPAIDAGTMDLSLFPTNYEFPLYDFAGEDRIFGSSIDIGCYEYQGYTGIDEIVPEVRKLSLSNYPNPFNPETTISFELPVKGKIELSIFNIRGQKITTLINKEINRGTHSIVWNGEDENGKSVPSGVYFYKLNAKGKSITKKMILMK